MGCDQKQGVIRQFEQCFNPRTHMGCDCDKDFLLIQEAASFNPRTHMGCDITPYYSVRVKSGFQSTHPHGVRQLEDDEATPDEEFQSTHPHGVRLRCAP